MLPTTTHNNLEHYELLQFYNILQALIYFLSRRREVHFILPFFYLPGTPRAIRVMGIVGIAVIGKIP